MRKRSSLYALTWVIVVTLLVATPDVVGVSVRSERPEIRMNDHLASSASTETWLKGAHTIRKSITKKEENALATSINSTLAIDPVGIPLVGAQIANDWVTMFSSEEPPPETGGVEVGWFYITGLGTYRTIIADLIPGEDYYVSRDGTLLGTYAATGSGPLDFDLPLYGSHLVTISCFADVIPATIDIEPDTLNLASRGTFTVFITLPEGCDAEDIVTVECEGIPAAKGKISEDSDTYVAKFNRQDLANALTGSEISLKVTGEVRQNGTSVYFEGSDTIRIIHKGKPSPAELTFSLRQNFGNPFNPDTWIPYTLAEGVDVVIRIYSSSGQLIRTLDLGHEPAGFYTTKHKAAYWDGRNEEGENVSSGIYFYSIQAGDFTAIRKMATVE